MEWNVSFPVSYTADSCVCVCVFVPFGHKWQLYYSCVGQDFTIRSSISRIYKLQGWALIKRELDARETPPVDTPYDSNLYMICNSWAVPLIRNLSFTEDAIIF